MTEYQTQETPSWDIGSLLFDEFVIERHLGKGGFGQVELVRSDKSGERYAAKRIIADDQLAQGRFLTEAQRWMSLPDHPNITSCHFVRTVGAELVLFSTYVSGGSLADWIGDGRLYRTGDVPVLDRLIDIAVQTAWGLDAAHGMGLLHLDVKPSNVLVADDLRASVTDFGLASGGEREPGSIAAEELVLDFMMQGIDEEFGQVLKGALRKELQPDSPAPQAQAEGLSSPYASPEQAEHRRLDRSADVWSWAVTVLEMFVGDRTWSSGTVAGMAMERLVAEPGACQVAMPPNVAEILRACFRAEPAERPQSTGEVADLLAASVEGAVRRPTPPRPSLVKESAGVHERTLVSGARWTDPRAWLNVACEAGALEAEPAARLWPSGLGSRKSQALEDLRALTEADRALSGLAAATPEQRLATAVISIDVGHIHMSLGDIPGAIQAYQRSTEISSAIDEEEARLRCAEALNHLAIALRTQGRDDEALTVTDRALAICRPSADAAGSRPMLAAITLTKANATSDLSSKLSLYDQAVSAFEAAGQTEGTVKALAARAAALDALGHRADADHAWDLADEKANAFIHLRVKSPGILSAQARARINRAEHARTIDDQLRYAAAAIDILRPVVEDLGWYELTGDLGKAVFLTGTAYEAQGQSQAALDAYHAARQLFEAAVFRDGQLDLTSDLARSGEFEATWIGVLQDPRAAVRGAEHAVGMWRRLADLDGPAAWAAELSSASVSLGRKLLQVDDLQEALDRFDEALRIATEAPQSPALSLIIAQAHLGRGYVLRRANRSQDAVAEYRIALQSIEGMTGEQDIHARAGILQSLSNAYRDEGSVGEALQLQQASIAELEQLSQHGQPSATIRSDLADAYQRRTNMLEVLGEHEKARDSAVQGLAVYRDLIKDGGRRDLIVQAARLQSAYGMILEQLGDLDGAVAELSAGRESLARAVPGATTLRDILGPAWPAVTVDAFVGELDRQLTALKQRLADRSA